MQPEGDASDSERAEEDCGASLPALKALPSPDSREGSQDGCTTNMTHSAMLCGQAAMPLWSSNTRVDGLGRAPVAALAAIFLPDESSSGEATSSNQGRRNPS